MGMHIREFIGDFRYISDELNNNRTVKNFKINLSPIHKKNINEEVSRLLTVRTSLVDGTINSVIYSLREETENEGAMQKFELEKLSHDVRSPLHAMSGLIALLTKNHEEAKEYLDYLNKSEQRLLEMSENTLNNLKDSKSTKASELINFSSLIEEVISMLAEGFNEVKFKVTDNSQKSFYSRKPIIHSVLQNLVSNSIRYRKLNHPDSYTEIIIDDIKGSAVRIQVKDNGIGIESKNLSKIFEREFRVPNLTVEGNGLGLYLVKKQIEDLNGTIQVESSLGEGTTFTICIPSMKTDQSSTSSSNFDLLKRMGPDFL
jgi:signal transduction histidine kinase